MVFQFLSNECPFNWITWAATEFRFRSLNSQFINGFFALRPELPKKRSIDCSPAQTHARLRVLREAVNRTGSMANGQRKPPVNGRKEQRCGGRLSGWLGLLTRFALDAGFIKLEHVVFD
jgi:hypothetical protein